MPFPQAEPLHEALEPHGPVRVAQRGGEMQSLFRLCPCNDPKCGEGTGGRQNEGSPAPVFNCQMEKCPSKGRLLLKAGTLPAGL